MRSPHTSPSLRSIAHMHTRASYFPSQPSSPVITSSIPRPPSPNVYHTDRYSAHAGSPLASPRSPYDPRPTQARPPMAPRRPTYTSNIPVGYSQPPTHIHHRASAPVVTDARRRPSFKIDLPPRPAPCEMLAGNTPFATSALEKKATPFPTPRDEVGAGRQLSQGPLEMTDMRNEIDAIAYRAHAQQAQRPMPTRKATAPPTFRDPFAPVQSQGGYMILRGPSEHSLDGHAGSHRRGDSEPCAGAVGLGYSLNKLRAPTPWVRKPADEGDWLTAEDVSRFEH